MPRPCGRDTIGAMVQRPAPLLVALALPLTGLGACVADVDEDGDHDHAHPLDLVDGRNAGHTLQGLARAGRWQPSPEVMAIGDLQLVAYNPAPSWSDGANCSDGATDGALTLRDHLLGFFPQIASVGIYNCRPIAGTNSMSLHGVGRALDIMIPTVNGDADNDLGDPIAAWLIMNAAAIGMQTIIWDHSIWRVTYDPRIHEYSGENPHVDHLHVEINVDAGQEEPPWFEAPFGPEACAELPPGESVIDNGDDCLRLYGPGQYWRDEVAGFGGDLMWTNAFENDTASNWAEWRLPFEEPAEYEVAVHIDPTFGVYQAARYRVTAGEATHDVVIDQGAASGWTTLGTFRFTGAPGEGVKVFDNAPGPVAGEQHIVVDALRVRPPSSAPPPEEPPPEEPPPPSEEPPPPDEPPPEKGSDDDPAPVDDDEDHEGEGDAGSYHFQPSVTAQACSSASPASAPALALVIALAALRRRR